MENNLNIITFFLSQYFQGPHPYRVWTFCKWSVCLSVSNPFLIGCEKSRDKILCFWLSWHKFNHRQLKCEVIISYRIFARRVPKMLGQSIFHITPLKTLVGICHINICCHLRHILHIWHWHMPYDGHIVSQYWCQKKR